MDENPYASPETNSDRITNYYAVEVTNLSLLELWRMAFPNISGILNVILAQLMGSSIRGPAAIRRDALVFLAEEEIPEFARTAMEEVVSETALLGFRKAFASTVNFVGNLPSYTLTLANVDGTISASVTYMKNDNDRELALILGSELDNGTILRTINTKPGLADTPKEAVRYLVGAAPARLLGKHKQRLAQCSVAQPLLRNSEQLRQSALASWNRFWEHNIQRGVYVPLTELELEKLMQHTASAEPPAPANDTDISGG